MPYALYNGKLTKYNGKLATFFPTIATGGVITTDGDYKIHTFDTSGTFQVVSAIDVSALVVGGGGSAWETTWVWTGSMVVGGSGGGGKVIYSSFFLEPSLYQVTVAGTTGRHKSGGTSSFNGIDASGGVRGVQEFSGASGSGNAAGNSFYQFLGGGGGDSEAGIDYSFDPFYSKYRGGEGGAGTYIPGLGTFGGGGGGFGGLFPVAGGSGGGGASGRQADGYPLIMAEPGEDNTGGGGAGNACPRPDTGHTTSVQGSRGGSGIVVIKYKYK